MNLQEIETVVAGPLSNMRVREACGHDPNCTNAYVASCRAVLGSPEFFAFCQGSVTDASSQTYSHAWLLSSSGVVYDFIAGDEIGSYDYHLDEIIEADDLADRLAATIQGPF